MIHIHNSYPQVGLYQGPDIINSVKGTQTNKVVLSNRRKKKIVSKYAPPISFPVDK